ncbi:PQQ-binding-like beta-propeller repeat protein [Alteromonas sp. H39]|uniref:outer membrane protein assembly factor BamB family protein n=1 Tax=Alteromonas sp. H39 TaxID=3389876 RepID=UPI0039E038F4
MKSSRCQKLRRLLNAVLVVIAIIPQAVIANSYSVHWENELSLSVWSSPLSTSDNQLLIGTDKGNVFLFASDGNEAWKFDGKGRLHSSPIELSNGQFVFGSETGIMYSLSKDGASLWDIDLGAAIEAAAIESTGNRIFVGTKEGKIFALSSDGDVDFSFDVGAALDGKMTRSPDGQMLANTNDGRLLSFNDAGVLLWEYQSETRLSSPTFDSNSNVYFTSLGGDVISLTKAGQLRWIQTGKRPIWAPPTFNADGALITVDIKGRVTARDISGEKIWGYSLGAVTDSAPVAATNGTTYFATRDSDIVAIDVNGVQLWTEKVSAPVHASMSLNGQGYLTAVSTNGVIVSIQTDTYPLKDDSLPQAPSGFITLDKALYTINEGESVDVTLVRKEGTTGILEARVFTRDVSAASGSDYTAINETVRFEDGELQKAITLITELDPDVEEDKSLEVWVEFQGVPAVSEAAVIVLSNVTQEGDDDSSTQPETPSTPSPAPPTTEPSASSKSGGSVFVMLPLLIAFIAFRKRELRCNIS